MLVMLHMCNEVMTATATLEATSCIVFLCRYEIADLGSSYYIVVNVVLYYYYVATYWCIVVVDLYYYPILMQCKLSSLAYCRVNNCNLCAPWLPMLCRAGVHIPLYIPMNHAAFNCRGAYYFLQYLGNFIVAISVE